MTPPGARLGLCSWSLRPEGPGALVAGASAVGVDAVQLALDPLRDGRWSVDDTVEALRVEGLSLRSGMMEMIGEDYSTLESIRRTGGLRPDEHWPANRAAAERNAALAARLELPLVSFHAGFLPEDPDDAERHTLLERLREVADLFSAQGVAVALETGQETAETLLEVLAAIDRPHVGVNFDPANMLLYGMGDPLDALARLAPHVLQVHVKDARPSSVAGEWGAEVPVGTGAVDWAAFFALLKRERPDVDLMIEREAGDQRVVDMCTARDVVRRYVA